jgi:hypothetical protein
VNRQRNFGEKVETKGGLSLARTQNTRTFEPDSEGETRADQDLHCAQRMAEERVVENRENSVEFIEMRV